jgi:hypothetical protein
MNYLHLEIAVECAFQISDRLGFSPKAESRWMVADVAKRIIQSDIISVYTDDIDEVIAAWISANEDLILREDSE